MLASVIAKGAELLAFDNGLALWPVDSIDIVSFRDTKSRVFLSFFLFFSVISLIDSK